MRFRWLLVPWHALFGCRICHGTGVIITKGCDCGSGPWSPHESLCGTVQCPHKCRIAPTKDDALKVWRRHWERPFAQEARRWRRLRGALESPARRRAAFLGLLPLGLASFLATMWAAFRWLGPSRPGMLAYVLCGLLWTVIYGALLWRATGRDRW
jgi:hypothetical protein